MSTEKNYKDVFSNIYENYGFGSLESRSGPGSTLDETKSLREKILNLIKERNIKSVVDIPCGDFNWMKEIVGNFESYLGGDIVSESVKINNEKYGNSKIRFIDFDLIEDRIPDGDLLIVRDVIGHLPLEDGIKVIKNILNSNCKYLLSTTWAKKTETGWDICKGLDVDRENEGVNYGSFYPVNLMAEPFNLLMPELILEENVIVDKFEYGNRKTLSLWDLSELKAKINIEKKTISENSFQQTKPNKNMIYIDKITKRSDLENDLSLTTYDNEWDAQQNYKSFETFFYFLKEIRPSRILEIGTSKGGFTHFLNESCKTLNLDCHILSLDINEFPWYSRMIESGIDLRIENVFNDDYTDVKDYIKDFISSVGTTMVLCDGGDKQKEFKVLSEYLKDGDFILGHDYSYDKETFLEKINGKIWNWLELTESDIKDTCLKNNLVDYRRELFESVVWVCKMKLNKEDFNNQFPTQSETILNESKTTFVTGLWNIKRSDLNEGWSRSYEHYLEKFKELLKTDNNFIIYGDDELESFVWEHRKKENTQFIRRSLDWFRASVPYNRIQEIRNNPEWYSQSGWLPDSTQAKLEMYNPLVMSKMFLLHDAKILDQFNSEHMYWIDAGITNTIHPGYFTHDKIQHKLPIVFSKFGFVCFPYDASNEIHGFSYPKINQYAGKNVKLVARGGLFGGPKDTITDINNIYYSTLNQTLGDGYMGTEESIFSIMLYKHPDLIDYVQIEDNGLISKFCEDLKNDTYEVKNTGGLTSFNSKLNSSNTALYVITFNSPNQFETLINSMLEYDRNFIDSPKKFLLDNSSDLSTTPRYQELCSQYGFEHIKKDNLGICGGRQWIAEHFDKTGLDFYFFFEDDMFFYPKKGEVCKNGFNRFVDNFYNSTLDIVKKYNYDFLKFNYTEFFGDNGTQWAWYNVPQDFRESHWPEKSTLPVSGLDPNAPRTQFKHIRVHNGIPFIDGEVYFCNWPQIITKHGNKKIFLTTTWAHPYEQTWMSYVFQETIKGEINMSMLLMSPTEHNRFDFYSAELRKES